MVDSKCMFCCLDAKKSVTETAITTIDRSGTSTCTTSCRSTRESLLFAILSELSERTAICVVVQQIKNEFLFLVNCVGLLTPRGPFLP